MLSFHHLRNNIFQGTFGTTLTIILLFWEIFTETGIYLPGLQMLLVISV